LTVNAAIVAYRDRADATDAVVLDNMTLTWVTNTGVSSGRLYWENTLGFFDIKGTTVPAAVSVLPNELYQAPRSWADKAYPKLIYFNEVDKGNHFAAWQEPDLFTSEARARVPITPLTKGARPSPPRRARPSAQPRRVRRTACGVQKLGPPANRTFPELRPT
jgi:hypothetical protein